jgi:solute carrier family 35, member E1
LLFGVSYSAKTYIALFPLTIGVMLACSFDMSASNAIGLLCAFGSALVFVSSNIFFKKIMPSNSSQTSHKLDKLNLLLYSSSMAFVLMIPVWMYYDLPVFLSGSGEEGHDHSAPESSYSVAYYFFLNGTVHFAQNLIAFIILSSTSPVTYSIASLVKRVAVICIAIIWFKQTVHVIQGLGIVMTFLGLHMYNNAKGDVEKGEKKMRRVEAARDMMLPSTKEDAVMMGTDVPPVLDLHAAAAAGLGLSSRTRGHTSGMSSRFQPLASSKSVELHASSPTLTIEVSQAALSSRSGQKHVVSPIESYPSPPLSLDSPPSPHRALEPIEAR